MGWIISTFVREKAQFLESLSADQYVENIILL